MLRQVDLKDISDGKLYELNDMVKVGCNDCEGCFACCKGMGSSIILDPYDVFRLVKGLNVTFGQLLQDSLELNIVDGIILPNIRMNETSQGCNYLDENGRCSIHAIRPGICRIFPLGRYYENGDFKYFLQVNECKKDNRSKVKVNKWIDTPELKKNHKFINDWHYFQKDVQEVINSSSDDQLVKNVNMYILNNFFIREYNLQEDFYTQFDERLKQAREILLNG